MANDFVARDKRVAGHSPVVVDHVNVGVADSVVGDLDVGVVLAHGLGLVGDLLDLRLGLGEAHSLDLFGDSGHSWLGLKVVAKAVFRRKRKENEA